MWLWALLPICLAVFGIVGIWVVFGIAVSNETVNITDRIPYISECGTYNPQSCIFAQICNICAILALWVVVIRFQQVRDYGQNSKVNIASIVLGFISCVGISIIGNFQQSVVIGIHLLGAFLTFFVGLAYFWLQVWLCYKAQPFKDRHWVGPLRATFCSICSVLVITSILTDHTAGGRSPFSENVSSLVILHTTSYKSGAAVCEWALVMSFFVLFGLFGSEFRHIDFHQLTVQKQGLKTQSTNGVVRMNYVS
ncbi:modulator of macroautophagy TMEM150B-like [Salvelinus fontinalis]|uniref:modulator of macroautophagy TMEM150B-like n=1 Tax=Salvelinus fontinalis TaxID=8038 RepID=UPI00248574E0|nr:modulator of macroautophagy TMEM150B-like [Salvelinus fontinalis]